MEAHEPHRIVEQQTLGRRMQEQREIAAQAGFVGSPAGRALIQQHAQRGIAELPAVPERADAHGDTGGRAHLEGRHVGLAGVRPGAQHAVLEVEARRRNETLSLQRRRCTRHAVRVSAVECHK